MKKYNYLFFKVRLSFLSYTNHELIKGGYLTMKKNVKPISLIVALTLILTMIATVLPSNISYATDNTSAQELIDEGTTVFTFTDDSISVENGDTSTYKIENNELTIKSPGTYILTGSCSDGGVKVKKETTGVTLVLYNLTLASSSGAPIVINKGNTDTKIILDGTNTLTDNENPEDEESTDETIADNFEGAALKIKAGGDLTIEGTGTLNLNGSSCKNGLKSGDEDTDNGYGGTSITINSGTINIQAANDGIHAYSLSILGGNINVNAGDDGLKADIDLNIGTKGSDNGPTIAVTNSYEALEGATINLYSGNGNLTSSDDGINAANSDLTDYSFSLNVYGGNWIINSGGDGLDSNGSLNIYGGNIEVFSSTENDNVPFDYDENSTFSITGGTIIGIGMSGMSTSPTNGLYVSFGSNNMDFNNMNNNNVNNNIKLDAPNGMPGQGGQQGNNGAPNQGIMPDQGINANNISISAGDTITIKDNSGNVLYTTTALKSANSILFSSEKLIANETYGLYVNDVQVATASAKDNSQSETFEQPNSIILSDNNTNSNSNNDINASTTTSTSTDTTQTESTTKVSSAPKTEDKIMLYSLIALLSSTAMISCIYYIKRKAKH